MLPELPPQRPIEHMKHYLVSQNENDYVKTVYELSIEKDYLELVNILQEFIGADCYAVSVAGAGGGPTEVLFDLYNQENMTFKEIIEQDLIRQQLYTKLHSTLLSRIHRKNKPCHVLIYLHRHHSIVVVKATFSPSSRLEPGQYKLSYYAKAL